MNELQKIELDLFLCFDSICKNLNLKYFLVAGSALGAVRHGGFIPWDDDLDVGMYREDYDRFMESAPSLLPTGIFLQNYKTDPQYPYVFAKLRNSNTTFVEKLLSNFSINHGVYIDIFPLDGYPEDILDRKKLSSLKTKYRRKLFCGFKMPRSLKSKVLALILRFFGYHRRTAETLAQYELLISKYPVKDSKIICSHGNRYGERDYLNKTYYGNGLNVLFEGIQVRIPEKYDEYLTALYGNWRQLPPPEEQKGVHPYIIFDMYKSYTEYENNLKSRLKKGI